MKFVVVTRVITFVENEVEATCKSQILILEQNYIQKESK